MRIVAIWGGRAVSEGRNERIHNILYPRTLFFCKLKFLISIQPNAIKCHIYIYFLLSRKFKENFNN